MSCAPEALPAPPGGSFTVSCGVEPFVSVTHSGELSKGGRRRLICLHGPDCQPRVWHGGGARYALVE